MDDKLHVKGFMPHGHPTSRDWGYENIQCRRTKCVCNVNSRCISPARCVIGERGNCEGFEERKVIVEERKNIPENFLG